MIKKYSLSKDGQKILSKNFSVQEFACKDGSDTILIDTDLILLLQNIRDTFNSPVVINSAYRNEKYNRQIGGVANSQHIYGTASDIVVQGVPPRVVAEYVESMMPNKGGIGLYSDFLHVDTRKHRARWENYGAEKAVSTFKREYLTFDEAIEILNNKGIVSQPDKWNTSAWTSEDVKWLIRKVGTYIHEN